MTESTTLTPEQIAEIEENNNYIDGKRHLGLDAMHHIRQKNISDLITAIRASQERVAELEEVAEAAEAFFKMPFNPLNTNYINPLEGAALSDALKKAGYLK